jgi:hypothetical protein
MWNVAIGFLTGLLAASVALWVVRDPRDRFARLREEPMRSFIELILIALGIFLLVPFVILVLRWKAVTWIQISLGVVAGFAFRSWIRFALQDLMSTATLQDSQAAREKADSSVLGAGDELPKGEANGKESETVGPRWWLTEPWRGLVIIAVLMIAAVFIPYIDGAAERLVREMNKLKVGGVELDLAERVSVHKRINIDAARKATQERSLDWFLNPTEQGTKAEKRKTSFDERLESDHRYLKHLAKYNSSITEQRLKQAKEGEKAFIKLLYTVIIPVADCVQFLAEGRADVDQVRQFMRDFTWKYRLVVRGAEELTASKGTATEKELRNRLEKSVDRFREVANKWLTSQDDLVAGTSIKSKSYTCKPQDGDNLLAGDAEMLVHYPWTFLALSTLDFFDGDGLTAIEELETHREEFWYEPNIFNLLGQYWQAEGDSVLASEAFSKFLKVARSFYSLAQENLSTASQDRNPATQVELSFDVNRGKKAVALAESAWALEAAQVGNASDAVLREAEEEVRSAIKVYFGDLGGYAEGNAQWTVPEILKSPTIDIDQGSTFWMSVDSHAYVILANAVRSNDRDDELGCAAYRLKVGAKWYLDKMQAEVDGCRNANSCTKFRLNYVKLDSSYRDVIGHLRLVENALSEFGKEAGCHDEKAWSMLRRPRPFLGVIAAP